MKNRYDRTAQTKSKRNDHLRELFRQGKPAKELMKKFRVSREG